MKAYVPGEVAVIEMRLRSDRLQYLFGSPPQSETIQGIVQHRAEYDPPNSIRLLTTCPIVPIRVIEASAVINLNGHKLIHKPKVDDPKQIKVEGSKGNTYIVTIYANGNKTCTCPGFGFRKTCKHTQST